MWQAMLDSGRLMIFSSHSIVWRKVPNEYSVKIYDNEDKIVVIEPIVPYVFVLNIVKSCIHQNSCVYPKVS